MTVVAQTFLAGPGGTHLVPAHRRQRLAGSLNKILTPDLHAGESGTAVAVSLLQSVTHLSWGSS